MKRPAVIFTIGLLIGLVIAFPVGIKVQKIRSAEAITAEFLDLAKNLDTVIPGVAQQFEKDVSEVLDE